MDGTVKISLEQYENMKKQIKVHQDEIESLKTDKFYKTIPFMHSYFHIPLSQAEFVAEITKQYQIRCDKFKERSIDNYHIIGFAIKKGE